MAARFGLLVDEIAGQIDAGMLKAGHRLEPVRDFAFKRGIAVSTASRVYAELAKRSLVQGEVGRGTFVSSRRGQRETILLEPAVAPIDLEMVSTVRPEQIRMLRKTLASLAIDDLQRHALQPAGPMGHANARVSIAGHLRRGAWQPPADTLLFAGNGKQAIAAAMRAIAPQGGRVGVESVTYPAIKSIAAELAVELVPIAIDDRGMLPEELARCHAARALQGVYFQSSAHSPTGVTMPDERRQRIAERLRALSLVAIEDSIYGFLTPDLLPVAVHAPDHVVLVDSFSKRLGGGLGVGAIVAPPALREAIARILRAYHWTVPGLTLGVVGAAIADGVADAIEYDTRRDACHRQKLARSIFSDVSLAGDERACHLWLPLGGPWRSDEFVAAALRHGIAVAPSDPFCVVRGHAPQQVRLALTTPDLGNLEAALTIIARLRAEGPPFPRTE